jgi:hypothetical protein
MERLVATHPQTWVKINALVDEGVAEIVSILNTVDGLETLQSCQGEPGERDSFVYFACGDWKRLSEFIFERIGPALRGRLDEDVTLLAQATSADVPMAKLSFRAEAAETVGSVLKAILSDEPPKTWVSS